MTHAEMRFMEQAKKRFPTEGSYELERQHVQFLFCLMQRLHDESMPWSPHERNDLAQRLDMYILRDLKASKK